MAKRKSTKGKTTIYKTFPTNMTGVDITTNMTGVYINTNMIYVYITTDMTDV